MDVLSNRAVWACVFVGLLLAAPAVAQGGGGFQSWRHLLMLALPPC
jgi:hypothetical protein